MFKYIQSWFRSEEGVAAIEAALVFPVMLVMVLGVYDMGNGILANQKTIRASQVAADLVTRHRSIDDTQLNEAIEAARLAYEPISSAGFGIDIISIRFDENSNGEIVWRETRNMTAIGDALARVASLAEPNSGAMIVAVEYTFHPLFAGFVIDEIPMQEIAFSRGRKTAVVTRT